MEEQETGWAIFQVKGVQHVMPIDENHKHSTECRCGWHEEQEGIIVHHSYDGREAFERGERKPS